MTVTGLPGAPIKGNLVLRALDALRSHAGVDFSALELTLEKRIPMAAGLGGGSSDAASALHLAQAAWGLALPPDEEIDLAISVGSDVPFFYWGLNAALVYGRGDHLSWLPVQRLETLGLLLLTPAFRLSTAKVFARYDEITAEQNADPDLNEDLAGFFEEPFIEDILSFSERLRGGNDLWPAAAALEPALPALRGHLERITGRPWLMSGSGPTLFALYASVAEAADAGKALIASGPPSLEDALINAVDLVGPDPAWRYP